VLVVACGVSLSVALLPEPEMPGLLAPSTEMVDVVNKTGNPFRPGSRASFARLRHRIHARAGVVIGPAARGSRGYAVGAPMTGRAWSTIKVPIAAAVIAKYHGYSHVPSYYRGQIKAALHRSDNGAAQTLFASLGSRAAAGRRMEQVMARLGDSHTRVSRNNGWGTTQWSLLGEEHFAAGLRCFAYGKSLMNQMTKVEPDQRWGLGRLSRKPVFKGGWGPGAGGYLVRQLGQIKIGPSHVLAVAIYAKANDGSFESGAHALSRIAKWIPRHVIASRIAEPDC
jgi:hypothetical protein